jgi:energy-coupling factor transporter transmembrane protein EcfT
MELRLYSVLVCIDNTISTKGVSMIYILFLTIGWFYIAAACLCFRRLKRKFLIASVGWTWLAAVFWPACLLLWILHHSISKSVDWAEELLEENISAHRTSASQNENAGGAPD